MTDQKRKLTPADIESVIVSEHTFTAGDGMFGAEVIMCGTPVTNVTELNRLTFCVLVLQNGFTVVGTNHGSADAANFDAALGRKYAREVAVEQIWQLEGYLLKQKLHEAA